MSQHMIQSFAPGEITPEKALEIGIELCQKFLKEEYQYYLAVHTDKEHIHLHCVFNNTNMYDGRTFETHENQGKKSERSWKKLMDLSDEICHAHSLSVIENAETSKGKSHYEWDMSRQNLSWKAKLKFAIDQVVKDSDDFEDFLQKCKVQKIEVVYNPTHKIDLKFRLQGQQRFTRAKTLGWYYETRQIKRRIEMFHGIISYTPKTKIIATDTEKMQNSFGLQKWADLKNKQELSRAINIASHYCTENNLNLENILHLKYRNQGVLVDRLNHIKTEIDDLKLKIQAAKIVQKYSCVSEQSRSLTGHTKDKFDKEHCSELQAYTKALRRLKEWFSDGRIPTPESMDKKRSTLLQECSELNQQYSVLKSEIKELNHARQTLDDYFRNERNNQLRKKKGELE